MLGSRPLESQSHQVRLSEPGFIGMIEVKIPDFFTIAPYDQRSVKPARSGLVLVC